MGYSNVNFSKKTVFLVTGGAGFIGSNLCEAILKKGCYVRCLDNFSTGKRENIQELVNNPKFTSIEGDVRSLEVCINASLGADYILHHAALGSVPRSMNSPLLYCENNVLGTLNILEAARQNNVKRVVYASSSSVYGDEPNLPKTEGREGNILSPYALTKKNNEDWAILYNNSFGVGTIGLRYFNVFGRRQDPYGIYAAVIPRFIKAVLNNEEIEIYGDGSQSRDFTYIENVIEANLKAIVAPSEACGMVFNIACGEQVNLLSLLTCIQSLTCLHDKKILFKSNRVGDIKHSRADISMARNFLNYNPSWTFEKGLADTIKWYLAHRDCE